MLPTLACVKKEKTVDYVVGFDELGGSDDFSTHTLAGRLSLHGLITYDGTEDYGEANPNQAKIKGLWKLWETISLMLRCNSISQAHVVVLMQAYSALCDMVVSAPQHQMTKIQTSSSSVQDYIKAVPKGFPSRRSAYGHN